jgi:DNA-binding transcriptional ArsR family regulator
MTHRSDDAIELDATGLKALAHPVRARLLAALRSDGPATASQLAERFATNSGQTSYHLRVLADAGFVEEEAGRGTARERWWRARHRSTHIEARQFRGDPASEERLRWLMSQSAVLEDRLFQRWLDEMDDYPAAWRDAADASDWQLRLTPAQVERLADELAEVVGRYAAADAAAAATDPDAERVMVVVRAFPAREVDLS